MTAMTVNTHPEPTTAQGDAVLPATLEAERLAALKARHSAQDAAGRAKAALAAANAAWDKLRAIHTDAALLADSCASVQDAPRLEHARLSAKAQADAAERAVNAAKTVYEQRQVGLKAAESRVRRSISAIMDGEKELVAARIIADAERLYAQAQRDDLHIGLHERSPLSDRVQNAIRAAPSRPDSAAHDRIKAHALEWAARRESLGRYEPTIADTAD